MDWITTDPAVIIVILIARSPIDINVLMVSAMGTTDCLSGKLHRYYLTSYKQDLYYAPIEQVLPVERYYLYVSV
ncbi:hypothetical protein [Shewanella woodyi]|uniref:hypothetical protein n=1 Tax=Shewanella woodyi TaxID=60961 RepID=UPI003749920C